MGTVLARYQGSHTGVAVELSVQNWYFAFVFVQLFLVVTIAAAITSVLNEIKQNVGSVPGILAGNLPKASNFFFSYILLQAFAVSGGALLQIGTLAVTILFKPFDVTAREKWIRATNLLPMEWGTLFPVATNLGVITIAYSIIAPLILFFGFILFCLFWVVYRYNLMFVLDPKVDSGGLYFPRAVNHLYTGIYVMEVCCK